MPCFTFSFVAVAILILIAKLLLMLSMASLTYPMRITAVHGRGISLAWIFRVHLHRVVHDVVHLDQVVVLDHKIRK